MRRWTRIAAYGLIVDEGRILLCRLAPVEEDVGKWTLPGGGLDFGESPEEGAIREIREETGLEVCLKGFANVDSRVFSHGDSEMHAIRIFYWAKPIAGELSMEVDGSTDQCAWFTEEEARVLPLVDIAQYAVDTVFSDHADRLHPR